MTHIMIDLETLSTLPNARIVAIGAVKFNTDIGVYDRFYKSIITPTLLDDQNFIDENGFHVSKDTLAWWKQQSPEASAVLHDANATTIDDALTLFTNWVMENARAREDNHLWGNGASFDNVILSSAYRLRDMEQPWRFWNDRCYRTVKSMFPYIDCARIGVHHNALNDAETQAEHLIKMWHVHQS